VGLVQIEGEVEALRVVVATSVLNGQGITPKVGGKTVQRNVNEPEKIIVIQKVLLAIH
jgi:hypothetical protein